MTQVTGATLVTNNQLATGDEPWYLWPLFIGSILSAVVSVAQAVYLAFGYDHSW